MTCEHSAQSLYYSCEDCYGGKKPPLSAQIALERAFSQTYILRPPSSNSPDYTHAGWDIVVSPKRLLRLGLWLLPAIVFVGWASFNYPALLPLAMPVSVAPWVLWSVFGDTRISWMWHE